jgi:hypothetical protein
VVQNTHKILSSAGLVQSTVKLGDGRRAREETNPEEKAAVSRERPKAYV